jgi:hypothetical protein
MTSPIRQAPGVLHETQIGDIEGDEDEWRVVLHIQRLIVAPDEWPAFCFPSHGLSDALPAARRGVIQQKRKEQPQTSVVEFTDVV